VINALRPKIKRLEVHVELPRYGLLGWLDQGRSAPGRERAGTPRPLQPDNSAMDSLACSWVSFTEACRTEEPAIEASGLLEEHDV